MAERERGGPGPGIGIGRGGPPEKCVCPHCGFEAPKRRGIPCRSITCPKCDAPLVGE